jgi:SAM-dependent methyltransferase
MVRPLSRNRRFALWTEVLFWWKWLREGRSSAVRADLLDPSRPLRSDLVDVVSRLGSGKVRILDVGAGPLTTIGFRHPTDPGITIEVTPTDVLAPSYERLLRKRGVKPVVPTLYCDAERLTEKFMPGSFDLAFAGNCLDHMERPVRAIEQMFELVRPGGFVVLVHFVDEGEKQEYTGLHAWNIRAENGRLIVANDRDRIDVAEHFGARAEVVTRVENDIVTAELRKIS